MAALTRNANIRESVLSSVPYRIARRRPTGVRSKARVWMTAEWR
jgi:hypothetical protein